MRSPIKAVLAVFILCMVWTMSSAYAQQMLSDEAKTADAASIRQVMTQYEFYTKTTPHEKVYLHTDKPYYSKGDTIWFKAYALLAGTLLPDTLNKTLYVDLVQQDGRVLTTQRLLLEDGLANGQIAFQDSLMPGYYMLRAYTNWMRNFTEAPLYSRLIPVYGRTTAEATHHWNTSYHMVPGALNDTLQMTLFLTDKQYKVQAGEPFHFDFRARGMHSVQDDILTDRTGTYKLNLNIPKQIKNSIANLTLTTGQGRTKEKTTIAVSLLRTDSLAVRFFPEGGNLVNNVCSRIAFQVADATGTGIPAKGTVRSSSGRVIQTFTADSKGQGAFYLTPRAGERYYAEVEALVDDWRGDNQLVQLPDALPKGYVMEVFNLNGREVQVCLKRGGIADEEMLGLTARTGGKLSFAKMLAVSQDSVMFTIPRSEFSSGVSQMTLFGTNGRPLCERLVFVNNYKPLKIDVKFPADIRKPRELIEMEIAVTDEEGRPVQADLSLSVTDATQVFDTARYEMNILTQMLLQSDLRGRIDNPAFYVADSTMAARKALEMLMLTNGWRRYDLSEALSEDVPQYDRRFEWALKISGAVKHMTLEYPLPDHQVTRLMGVVKKDAFDDNRWNRELRGWEYKLAKAVNPVDTVQMEKTDGLQLAEIDQTETDENGEFEFYSSLQGKYMMVLQTKKMVKKGKKATAQGKDAVIIDRMIELYDLKDSLTSAPFMQQLDMRPEERAAFLAAQRSQESIVSSIDAEDQQLRVLRDSITTYVIPAVEVVEPLVVAENLAQEMSSYQVDAEMAALMLANTDNSVFIPSVYDLLSFMYPNKFQVISEYDDEGNVSGSRYTWMGRPVLLFDLTPTLPRGFDGSAAKDYRSIEYIYVVESDHAVADVYEQLKPYPEYWEDLFNLQQSEEFGAVVVMFKRTQTKEIMPGIRRMYWEGYAEPAEFYSPDYASFNPDDPFDMVGHTYDRRSTLYWNPSIRTDEEGKATVKFYTSDRYTILHTDIQGMTDDGRLGTRRK